MFCLLEAFKMGKIFEKKTLLKIKRFENNDQKRKPSFFFKKISTWRIKCNNIA